MNLLGWLMFCILLYVMRGFSCQVHLCRSGLSLAVCLSIVLALLIHSSMKVMFFAQWLWDGRSPQAEGSAKISTPSVGPARYDPALIHTHPERPFCLSRHLTPRILRWKMLMRKNLQHDSRRDALGFLLPDWCRPKQHLHSRTLHSLFIKHTLTITTWLIS